MEELVKPHIPRIKICGIKNLREADFLNEAEVDYAGFVFYEKSKRNVSLAEAQVIGRSLMKKIKKVAVTVSPGAALADAIFHAGFDVIQIHGELKPEVLKMGISIWRAVNITEKEQLERVFLEERDLADAIDGYVADGSGYGGGKPFDWENMGSQVKKLTAGKKLILAGGLNTENVHRGIEYFAPDVVDVSSSVEEGSGKSREKILEFVQQVKNFAG